MGYVIRFEAGRGLAPDAVGNKAAGLAELQVAGFRVPPGFCLTVDAYRASGPGQDIPADVAAEALAAFRTLTPPLAVRSSSPSEDREDASFAGQYQTILGVQTEAAFLDAIKACWASARSASAEAYRAAQGETGDPGMALVVQELVPATAAGVLFTLHPVTDRTDQVVVNANYGLGESVVSGKAEPDTFILDKPTGRTLQTTIGAKKIQIRPIASGVEEAIVPEADRTRPSLSPSQLAQLSAAAKRLEAHFDMPIDAEWAFAGDTLVLLQARPITTGMAAYYTNLLDRWVRDRGLDDNPDAIWKRGSPLSGLPVTPLYYSEMSAFFSDMFPAVAVIRGGKGGKVKSFRYYNGYTYSNVTFSSAADPAGEIPESGFSSPAWRRNFLLALRYPRSYSVLTTIGAYNRRWQRVWLPGLDARRPSYDSAPADAIWDFIEYVEAQRRERSIYAALAVSYAGDYLGLLAHLLRRWAPGASEDTVGILTSGTEGSLTHDENVAVWALAQSAEKRPAVRRAILEGAHDRLSTVEGGPEFLAAVDAFRLERPHRGCSDRDLSQDRWGDSRSPVLDQMAAMLRLGQQADPEAAHERAASRRHAREREVLAMVARGIRGPLRRMIFRRVMEAAQRYWIHRDNQRHTFDRYFWELRCAYRALGARLSEQGALTAADDIFFLGKTEIHEALTGALAPKRARKRADWRKAWWARVIQREPPPYLQGNQPYQPELRPAGEGDVKGTGGAPGIARGPVRIVRNLHELSAVIAGDIVVAHAIDPAWTPVFGVIAGVVSEEGGMLSHATVLGREYGIPVVIGAEGAMTKLNAGVSVRIDGTRGLVFIEANDDLPDETAARGGNP